MSVRGRLSSRAWFVTFVSAVSVLVVGLAVAGWFVWANDSSTVVATNPAAPMFDAASLEDLAERLNADPPYDGNIDVDHEDELPTEIRSLMGPTALMHKVLLHSSTRKERQALPALGSKRFLVTILASVE